MLFFYPQWLLFKNRIIRVLAMDKETNNTTLSGYADCIIRLCPYFSGFSEKPTNNLHALYMADWILVYWWITAL